MYGNTKLCLIRHLFFVCLWKLYQQSNSWRKFMHFSTIYVFFFRNRFHSTSWGGSSEGNLTHRGAIKQFLLHIMHPSFLYVWNVKSSNSYDLFFLHDLNYGIQRQTHMHMGWSRLCSTVVAATAKQQVGRYEASTAEWFNAVISVYRTLRIYVSWEDMLNKSHMPIINLLHSVFVSHIPFAYSND
jgi:hypothetical protein